MDIFFLQRSRLFMGMSEDEISGALSFLQAQEKQYKNLSTPLQKQNFESQTSTSIRQKQEALAKLQSDKENQILTKIQDVAKQIMIQQKLDAVLSDQVVFVGGVDITDQVIQQLK